MGEGERFPSPILCSGFNQSLAVIVCVGRGLRTLKTWFCRAIAGAD